MVQFLWHKILVQHSAHWCGCEFWAGVHLFSLNHQKSRSNGPKSKFYREPLNLNFPSKRPTSFWFSPSPSNGCFSFVCVLNSIFIFILGVLGLVFVLLCVWFLMFGAQFLLCLDLPVCGQQPVCYCCECANFNCCDCDLSADIHECIGTGVSPHTSLLFISYLMSFFLLSLFTLFYIFLLHCAFP